MKYLKPALVFVAILFVITGIISAASRSQVEVFAVQGRASYLSVGATDWKGLSEGISLFSGDRVKTDSDVMVEIAFDAHVKSIVRVMPDSNAKLLRGRPPPWLS